LDLKEKSFSDDLECSSGFGVNMAEKEKDEGKVFLCIQATRENDPFIVPGNTKQNCEKCQAEIWVAPSSLEIYRIEKDELWCDVCVMADHKSLDWSQIGKRTPRQLDEIKNWCKQQFK
jgi:hypothetical protein